MMRRSRLSIRPNVRPTGRGPPSSQEGLNVNTVTAGKTTQATEVESNVTESRTVLQESVRDVSEDSGFIPTIETLSGKVSSNLAEKGENCEASEDGTPAATSLKSRGHSTVPNLAQPRVTSTHSSFKTSVPKAAILASCSVTPIPISEDHTATEDEGLKSPGQPSLSGRGQPPKTAEKPGSALSAISVLPPEYPAVSVREQSVQSQPSTSAVAMKVANMSADQQRIIKSRLLKEMMKEELRKERRKKAKPLLQYTSPLNHTQMTMRDLIYYLPETNPMTSCVNDEQAGQENLPLRRNDIVAKRPDEVEEDGGDSPSGDNLVVPKVKVAEDGSLILDEDSLTVRVARPTGPCVVEEGDPIFERGSTTTYSSFRKIKHVKHWSSKETEMFFLAISMVGTDFSMIGQLFPHRTRTEIKNKFKKEEKLNPWRIDKAFQEKRPYDQKFFTVLLEKILTANNKRNVNMQGSKAKKTSIKKKAKETATQDETCITIEEDELDCSVANGDMKIAEKENENSSNVLDVVNKAIPSKKRSKCKNTDDMKDPSLMSRGGKKRKTKSSVEVIRCDEVDSQPPTMEAESTMESTAKGNGSKEGTAASSPPSKRCFLNSAVRRRKRVTKKLAGSPQKDQDACCTEAEKSSIGDTVSGIGNEESHSGGGEVMKGGKSVISKKAFADELENMELSRIQCNSGGPPKHSHDLRPDDETATSSTPPYPLCKDLPPTQLGKKQAGRPKPNLPATWRNSCAAMVKCMTQEASQPVNDTDDVQDNHHNAAYPAQNKEVCATGSNSMQSFGRMSKEFEETVEEDIFQMSPENMDGLTEHMEYHIEEASESQPSQRTVAQRTGDPLLEQTSQLQSHSKCPEYVASPASGGTELRDPVQQVGPALNGIIPGEITTSPARTQEPQAVSLTTSCEDLFNSSSPIQHGPNEMSPLISTSDKSCHGKQNTACESPAYVDDERTFENSVQGVPSEHSTEDLSGVNRTQVDMSRSTDFMDSSLTQTTQISLNQLAEVQQSNHSSPTATSTVALPVDSETAGQSFAVQMISPSDPEKDDLSKKYLKENELSSTRDSSNKTSTKLAQSAPLRRKRSLFPKPNLSRVSRIPVQSTAILSEVKGAIEEYNGDPKAFRPVENRACLSLGGSSTKEKCPEAVMEREMQAIPSSAMSEAVAHVPTKGVSGCNITAEAMVTQDVTEPEPSFVLMLFPVSDEFPPPPQSTEDQSQLLLPELQSSSPVMECQAETGSGSCEGSPWVIYNPPTEKASTQNWISQPEQDLFCDQVPKPSLLEGDSESSQTAVTQKGTMDDPEHNLVPELCDPVDKDMERATSKKPSSSKNFVTFNKKAKTSHKKRVSKTAKKPQPKLEEEPDQLNVFPFLPQAVHPTRANNSTEEAVSRSAEVEMSQDAVHYMYHSGKSHTAESNRAYRSEWDLPESSPLITPLSLEAFEIRSVSQRPNDSSNTDYSNAKHSSISEMQATSPSSSTKVSSASQYCSNINNIDKEPTNISEYFFSDIFTEVQEESD